MSLTENLKDYLDTVVKIDYEKVPMEDMEEVEKIRDHLRGAFYAGAFCAIQLVLANKTNSVIMDLQKYQEELAKGK